MTVRVDTYYVRLFCHLAEFPLQEAVRGKDVEVERMPFELRHLSDDNRYLLPIRCSPELANDAQAMAELLALVVTAP